MSDDICQEGISACWSEEDQDEAGQEEDEFCQVAVCVGEQVQLVEGVEGKDG